MRVKSICRVALSCLLFSVVLCGQSHGIPSLKSVQIISNTEKQHVYYVLNFDKAEGVIDVDVEYDSDQFDVKIDFIDKNIKTRVEQRYETTLIIQNE